MSTSSLSSPSSPGSIVLDVMSVYVKSKEIHPRRVAVAVAKFFFDSAMVSRTEVQVGHASTLKQFSQEELTPYVDLLTEPALLGIEILKLLRTSHVPIECEVQLLVVAHFACSRGVSLSGLENVLQHIRSRYVKYEDSLLLRLLLGTGEYQALDFVMRRLLSSPTIMNLMTPELPHGLRQALLHTVRANGDALTMYTQLCMRTKMYRELADELVRRAEIRLTSVDTETLFQVMQLYIDASRLYETEECHRTASLTRSKAALMLVQEKYRDDGLVVINLDAKSAAQAMTRTRNAEDAAVIASAYSLDWEAWVPAIYARCIQGNADSTMFLSMLKRALGVIPAKLHGAVTKLFLLDPTKLLCADRFREFTKIFIRNHCRTQKDLKAVLGWMLGDRVTMMGDVEELDGNLIRDGAALMDLMGFDTFAKETLEEMSLETL